MDLWKKIDKSRIFVVVCAASRPRFEQWIEGRMAKGLQSRMSHGVESTVAEGQRVILRALGFDSRPVDPQCR